MTRVDAGPVDEDFATFIAREGAISLHSPKRGRQRALGWFNIALGIGAALWLIPLWRSDDAPWTVFILIGLSTGLGAIMVLAARFRTMTIDPAGVSADPGGLVIPAQDIATMAWEDASRAGRVRLRFQLAAPRWIMGHAMLVVAKHDGRIVADRQ